MSMNKVFGVFALAAFAAANSVFAAELSMRPGMLSVGLEAGVLYDDNLFLSGASSEVDDVLFTVSPSIDISTGDAADGASHFFSLSYVPTWSFFDENSDLDDDEHVVRGLYEFNGAQSTLGLAASYEDLVGNLTEFADRVAREVVGGALSLSHELAARNLLELFAGVETIDYEDFDDADEYFGQAAWLYTVSEKFSAGPGVRYGSTEVENTPDQEFVRVLIRTEFQGSGKLSSSGNFGAEFREFDGADAVEDRDTFVFDVDLTYASSETLEFVVAGYRHDRASSALRNRNYVVTGASASVKLALIQALVARIEGRVENSDYYNTRMSLGEETRDDDYVEVEVGLDYAGPGALHGGVFYRYRDNDSADPAVEFENNQVGVEVGLTF